MKTKATAKKRYCAANLREVAAINLDFHEQFGSEMVQISAILFSRHCHRAIFFYFSATATCATFLVCASGAVALKVGQVPSTSAY